MTTHTPAPTTPDRRRTDRLGPTPPFPFQPAPSEGTPTKPTILGRSPAVRGVLDHGIAVPTFIAPGVLSRGRMSKILRTWGFNLSFPFLDRHKNLLLS